MKSIANDNRFLAGLAGGAALALAGPPAVGAALASGLTQPLCAAGLVGAAGLVLAMAGRPRAGATPAPKAAARPAAAPAPMSPSPSDWAVASGMATVPPGERRAFATAHLSRELTPLPPSTAGAAAIPLEGAGRLLALALAMRGTPRDGTDVGEEMLRELADIHRDAEPGDVPARLAAMEGRFVTAALETGPASAAVSDALARHGTRETFTMGLLQAARRRVGVLAPAEFSWLRGTDRKLWYALQNVGRRRFLVDGLAAADHFRHELKAGHAIREPRVDMAVEAMVDALEGKDQA